MTKIPRKVLPVSLPSIVLLGLLVPSAHADAAQANEVLLRDEIQRLRDSEGVYSHRLIEPLGDLGRYYQEAGLHDLAVEVMVELRHTLRVNLGLDTLEELEPLQLHIRSLRELGRLAEAREVEQQLIYLAGRHSGASATLAVYRELANQRLALLSRYDAGDSREEIILGCYYGRTEVIAAMFIGEALANTMPRRNDRCDSGYRSTVRAALLIEARAYQASAIEALLQADLYADADMQTLVAELIRTSLRLQAQVPQYSDPFLRRILQRVLAFEPYDVSTRISHALLLVQVADFNVVRAQRTRRFSAFDVVLGQYVQAHASLADAGWSREQLDTIFAPAIPVLLPESDDSPFSSAMASGEWIELVLIVDPRGEAERPEIIATSAGVTPAQRDAVRSLVARSVFRPRLSEDKTGTAATVQLRYAVPEAN